MISYQELKKRYGIANTRKEHNWNTLYREVMELFCPNRENFYNTSRGQKKGVTVYTSHPLNSLTKFANNIQSTVFPPMKKWLKPKPGRAIPEQNREQAAKDLEVINNTVFDYVFASNFDTQIAEACIDLGVGTFGLLVTYNESSPLIFTAVPLNELAILPGPNGMADYKFRSYKIAYDNILKTWPDAQLDEDTKTKVNQNGHKEIDVLEGVVPTKVRVYNMELDEDIEVDGYEYVVAPVTKQGKVWVSRKMRYNPWVVARWSVMPGEIYGRGVCVNALYDAKSLNELAKLDLQNMSMAVKGAYTFVDDGVINISNVSLKPGSFTPVGSNGGPMGRTIDIVPRAGDPRATQFTMADLKESISQQMFTDPLGNLDQPVRTATEISFRQQELASRIGSSFGRLMFEAAVPIYNAILGALEEQGLIDMQGFKLDGINIAIEHISPLAMAQEQEDLNSLMRFVEFMVGMFGAQIAMVQINSDELVRQIAEKLAVSPSILASEEQKQQAVAMMAQMMQGQAEEQQEAPVV